MSTTPSLSAAQKRVLGLAAGVLATGATAAVLAAPADAATSDPFAALRQCESSGNYATNTGNGFYGAYQFDLATWRGLGYSGLPSAASAATQDAAAAKLQAQRGWAPWPGCSKKLGLTSSSATVSADVAASRTAAAATTSRSTTRVATTASTGTVTFTVAMANQTRDDVKVFQQQLNSLGFGVTVDGRYGRATARAVSAFELKYGLQQERVGIAGPQVKAKLASLVS